MVQWHGSGAASICGCCEPRYCDEVDDASILNKQFYELLQNRLRSIQQIDLLFCYKRGENVCDELNCASYDGCRRSLSFSMIHELPLMALRGATTIDW